MKPGPLARRIAQTIADARESAFEPVEVSQVGGGCIHEAWKLEGRGERGAETWFAKLNEVASAAMFEAEADGLDALRNAGAVRVPRAIARGDDGERAWLVLEWLDLVPLSPAGGAALGEALAAQHRIPQERFGWARDNFIGATPQPNGWSDDWLDFFRHQRLLAQLRLAARNRLPSKMLDRGERLVADCEALFRGYAPKPSLLHGDLWSGNAAMLADETPVVFDPATYVGDREADLAMTELFGGFPADFHAAYRSAFPPDEGYRARRNLYNLYHLFNHANLFAGPYVGQAGEAVDRLLAEIG